MSSIDQQFIEFIIKSLVSHPDDVKIERRIDEKGVLLELSVNPEDLGRVIGKRGATAQSIRTLLRALGTKNDARYNLKIVDTGPAPQRSSYSQSDDSSTSDDKPTDSAKADDVQPAKVADDVTSSDDDDDLPSAPTSHDDVISRTRAELADLDDLDL